MRMHRYLRGAGRVSAGLLLLTIFAAFSLAAPAAAQDWFRTGTGLGVSKPKVAVADFVSRGFTRRRRVPEEEAARLPPGQYAESGYPVLTAGPTPRVETSDWTLHGPIASSAKQLCRQIAACWRQSRARNK